MSRSDSRPEIPKEQIANSLWRVYQKTPEYQHGQVHSINSAHALVKQNEANGLGRIITIFIGRLRADELLKSNYCSRTDGDWIDEWYSMHRALFKTVFKSSLIGRFRKIDVRFGDVGDDELHGIPHWKKVPMEMRIFARQITDDLEYVNSSDLDHVCEYLAKVHYQFIRIHPFEDGNGRIARALTDQLGISLGLPPIIAGFPRTNIEKKKQYHNAITKCAGDPSCKSLKDWIKVQVTQKIEELA